MEHVKEIYYHMSCGCILTKDTIKKNRKGIICPEHKGTLKKRTIQCLNCRKILISYKAIGSMPIRCPKHAKLFTKSQRNIKYQESKSNQSVEKIDENDWELAEPVESDVNRCDCILYLSHCLIKYSLMDADTVPCKGCKSYVPQKAIKEEDPEYLNQYETMI